MKKVSLLIILIFCFACNKKSSDVDTSKDKVLGGSTFIIENDSIKQKLFCELSTENKLYFHLIKENILNGKNDKIFSEAKFIKTSLKTFKSNKTETILIIDEFEYENDNCKIIIELARNREFSWVKNSKCSKFISDKMEPIN